MTNDVRMRLFRISNGNNYLLTKFQEGYGVEHSYLSRVKDNGQIVRLQSKANRPYWDGETGDCPRIKRFDADGHLTSSVPKAGYRGEIKLKGTNGREFKAILGYGGVLEDVNLRNLGIIADKDNQLLGPQVKRLIVKIANYVRKLA